LHIWTLARKSRDIATIHFVWSHTLLKYPDSHVKTAYCIHNTHEQNKKKKRDLTLFTESAFGGFLA
jgi:hypothetical protein